MRTSQSHLDLALHPCGPFPIIPWIFDCPVYPQSFWRAVWPLSQIDFVQEAVK